MESNFDDAQETLRAADRAEVAPWVDFPPTPAWYAPGVGVWSALFVLSVGLLDDLVQVAAFVALLAVGVAFGFWYSRYRGTMPTGLPPGPFRRRARQFLAAQLVAVLVLAGLVSWSPWVAAGVALVAVTVIYAWYERAYAEAARQLRAELG